MGTTNAIYSSTEEWILSHAYDKLTTLYNKVQNEKFDWTSHQN